MVQNQEKSSIDTLFGTISKRNGPVAITGLSGAERAYFINRLYRKFRQPVVIVTAESDTAKQLLNDLRFFSTKQPSFLHYFPPHNVAPFKSLSYQRNTAAERIGTLYRLTEGNGPPVVVTTVEALSERLIPKRILLQYADLLMEGEQLDRDQFSENLVCGGYTQSVLVEEPGDFCMRGGIIDVFPPLYQDPIRIELFGDSVDSLRLFSATTQRSKASIGEVVILPASEAIFEREHIEEITTRLRLRAAEQGLTVTRIRELTGQLKTEGMLSDIEGFLPIVYPSPDTLFDYISESSQCLLIEPADIAQTAEDLAGKIDSGYAAACRENRLCVEPDDLYLTWSQEVDRLISYRPIMLKRLAINTSDDLQLRPELTIELGVDDNGLVTAEMAHISDGRSLFQLLSKWILSQKFAGNTTVVVCHTNARARNLKKMLRAYDVQLLFAETIAGVKRDMGRVWAVQGQLSHGFVWPEESLAVITEDEIFDTKSFRQKRPVTRRQSPPPDISDLNVGDLIVHADHGIGRYEGLVKLTINGLSNDFLLIVYKDEDRLYLPVDRMGMIEKYMGVDGASPTLDKMGGLSWARAKARVQRSAEKIAGELLKIYAARKVHNGYAFNDPASGYQTFTALFAFEETRDQQQAIEDVMADMAKPIPMDRLVCGDVGYGKTEVALRAAYMVADNAKQVAMVVPTTILAEQHFFTFSNRFKRTPFNVACLSRFRSARHQQEILNRLKTGGVDIVIGTHRLFSKDVEFKDLGIVILDEEQRFGVKHKEKLKRIRTTVDVLALTATPIPRTLHLSMTGVRDISIISTPPEYRQAIVTYVCEFDETVIRDAIRKELERGGQIYFVHNNIASIERMAGRLKQLVPEVRMDIAHGRMREEDLENTMYRFKNGEIDMLVCTTIIESGLDVAAANTMLVNRADRFGLSQMYQLRGRVGRSDRQAYAYLIIARESGLTRTARKRLKVLMSHSDLGSGFQIAMHDLKIRGGGTILGAAQSGHIAAVGYDMFLKLMKDAVTKLKGETTIGPLEPEINLPLAAYIPEHYMPDIDQRLITYRRLARMTASEEVTSLKRELKDRFGELPDEAVSLLVKIMLRILAIRAGVKRLDLAEKQLTLYLSTPHLKNPAGIIDWVTHIGRDSGACLSPNHVLTIRIDDGHTRRFLSRTKNILKEIIRHVNS